MINQISETSSIISLLGAGSSTNSNNTQSSDLISSFKDIFSSMVMGNSGSPLDQQNISATSDMMTPLLMILLLEKLVELQMDGSESIGTGMAMSESVPTGRPVGGVLTQEFHPGHNGLDFGIPTGTAVKATMNGHVTYAGWNDQGYGNLVIIENGAYKTYYAHLSSIPVSVGDTILAGSTIGLSGNTGNSTGPHLHYEIRKNNVPIDPTSLTLQA